MLGNSTANIFNSTANIINLNREFGHGEREMKKIYKKLGICIVFPNKISVNTKITLQIGIIQLSSKYKQPTDNLSVFYNHKTYTLRFV